MSIAISIIGFPLSAFLLLLFGKNFSKTLIALIGIFGILLSFFSVAISWFFLPFSQILYKFLDGFFINPLEFGLKFDSLSVTMASIVTFVSSLIAIYSAEYMSHENGYRRFFACINLFVFFMLLLVLADNLWLLFIGWEGVGLASYLLIGFFYREPQAVKAATKAFLTTRVGDVFLLFATFLCAIHFGTLNIETIKILAQNNYFITPICLCLLVGATGKSAQLPLQTWLADAMWGPTPVSALIHAATMVTAGVYLLVRMSFLIILSPIAQLAIMSVGIITLLMAGVIALFQTDIKRVLAYSTMSQIGFMFLAVGTLSFQAAIFHLATHAFFKALLFLSAGIIGHALHTYDLNSMSNLRKDLPQVFWFFIIGSFSLMGLPLFSGFFSKEFIINGLTPNSFVFYGAILGTFLTGLYTVRMLVLAFYKTSKKTHFDHSGSFMYVPCFILAFFSIFLGWLETPPFLGHIKLFGDFLSRSISNQDNTQNNLLWLIPTISALCGGCIAFVVYKKPVGSVSAINLYIKTGVFDSIYQAILIKPFKILAKALGPDYIKSSYKLIKNLIIGIFALVRYFHTERFSHNLSFMMMAFVALASIAVLS
jgi:NADH-quinone oxidoreductase subunit L